MNTRPVDRHYDEEGLQLVEIYQRQLALVDRILSYFSHYSALLLIVSAMLYVFGEAIFRETTKSYAIRALLVPPLFYLLIWCGNYRGLVPTLSELNYFRDQIKNVSQIPVGGNSPIQIRLFHLGSAALVLFIYALASFSVVVRLKR